MSYGRKTIVVFDMCVYNVFVMLRENFATTSGFFLIFKFLKTRHRFLVFSLYFILAKYSFSHSLFYWTQRLQQYDVRNIALITAYLPFV